MKATISIGGRFTAVFKLAEYLDRAGYLERLITFTPKFRLKDLSVTESRMANLSPLGAVNYAARYMGARAQFQTFRWIANEFDRQVSRRIGDCDIFYGWSGNVLQAMREAKRRGARTVVGTGIGACSLSEGNCRSGIQKVRHSQGFDSSPRRREGAVRI